MLIRLVDSRLRPAGMTNKNNHLRLSSSGLTRGSMLFQLKYERPKYAHVLISNYAVHQFNDRIFVPEFDDIQCREILLDPEDIFQRDSENMAQDYPVHTPVRDNCKVFTGMGSMIFSNPSTTRSLTSRVVSPFTGLNAMGFPAQSANS